MLSSSKLNVVDLKTITENSISTFKDKGSKFIGLIFPCKNIEEFENNLQAIKKEYWDASHHCYAYRLNPEKETEYSSDDGEPSGTAGLPILNQLKSFNLVDVGAVVIRYFGGTKLGKPGLIEAYGQGALQAIESSKLLTIEIVQFIEVSYPYAQENLINKVVLNHNLVEQKADYLADVTKLFACPQSNKNAFLKELNTLKHLSINYEEISSGYIFI